MGRISPSLQGVPSQKPGEEAAARGLRKDRGALSCPGPLATALSAREQEGRDENDIWDPNSRAQ